MGRLTRKVFEFGRRCSDQISACGNELCRETCKKHSTCKDCPIQEAIKKLCSYEDLEEQGKFLKLPCAVGDKYYCAYDGTYPIEWEFVNVQQIISVMDKIGKTVFLTREEAESALKKI